MTQQKTLKQRVRARMSKTGERYSAARRQVLAKTPRELAAESAAPDPAAPSPETPTPTYAVSGEAMVRATGRSHEEWFALLDAWGATNHTHTEIAEWLATEHAAPGWWRQSITVDYERARGMRARHEMKDGYAVSATKTVRAEPVAALAAFTDEAARRRWLPDAPIRPRPTRAKLTARFDWDEPPSRILVTVTPKGPGKSSIAVTHERLPSAADGARLKAFWRARLVQLASELAS